MMKRLGSFKRLFYKALRQPLYAARVFGKRLAARYHYRFSDGRSGYPEAVTLFLTHRCNLQCKMCGQWGEGGVTKKAMQAGSRGAEYVRAELDPSVIRSLIDDLAPQRPSVTLFGGEPLLYGHCLDIIRHIKSKGMHCLVITNGSLLEQLAADIVESGLDELNVSLDGASALHDEIRGMKGLFDRIMAGLKKVNECKRRLGRKKPLVNLQCTITRYNYKYLEQMAGVAEDAGADSLTFHNLIFTNKKLLEDQKRYDEILGASSKDWEGFDFEPGFDPETVYDTARRILSGKHSFDVDIYPNFSRAELVRYYNDPCFVPVEYPARCLSPWLVAYIFPDGEVRPCLNCTYSYGNIHSASFKDIWNSESAVRFRRTLAQEKIFPLCRRCTELYRY